MQQIIKSSLAPTPPMGWNSWDCFGVDVTEEEVRQNAIFMAENLKQYGWEYIVVDLGWYAPGATVHNYKSKNIPMLIDEYGRLMPVVERFPSAKDGKGFKPLADFIHGLGLKFGIHIMRGIPWKAAEENTPILNSTATANQIADAEDQCLWYNSMYGIDMTKEGGQAYYDSLIELYESWDVDFIKADDMGYWDGDGLFSPYRVDEVEALSKAVANANRDIVLSLSPGGAYIGDAYHLSRHAHLWRISCDFWDDWPALKRQFARCARWAKRTIPGHWPDADMLPLGKIGIRGEIGTPRLTNFTETEQYTLMTLWCIFRSPLMFGGHFPESDELSIQLISNAAAIDVNQNSKNNRELFRDENTCMWAAESAEGEAHFVALFNLSDDYQELSFEFAQIDLSGKINVYNIWKHETIGEMETQLSVGIKAHGSVLLKLDVVGAFQNVGDEDQEAIT